jgi:hypothetical protein
MIRTNAQRLVEGRILVIAALAAASLLFAKPAHADTFTVTNSNDDGVGIVVADGNKVEGNLIGTQKDATSPLGNSGERVA